jgi:hypothetical protein
VLRSSSFHGIACLVIAYPSFLCSQPHFLSLPFTNPSVRIQQGWKYNDGRLHLPKGAIDFVNGTLDNSATWQTFDVVAAADGVAAWDDDPVSDPSRYGNMVLVRHNQTDSMGRHYFTLYAHIQTGSIPANIPKLGRRNVQYAQWQPVTAGAFLGNAGSTGYNECKNHDQCIHLHFEVNIGAYFQNQTDAYGVNDKRNVYPGPCQTYLWISCPPIVNTSPTGTISVSGNLNGPGGNSAYNGPVSYTLVGPANFNTTQTALESFPNLSPGSYRVNYNSAGPPNSTLTGILPCGAPLIRGPSCDAMLNGGQTLPFTFQFTTNPTAGFLMISGNQSVPDGQTLNITVSPGGTAPVSVSAGASHANFPGGSILGWNWSVNGSQFSTSPSFGQAFSKGTYQIGLVVTDSDGAVSAPTTGTVSVSDTQPLGNGWRMSGYNGSRTNNSQSQGPATLPAFQPFITTALGNLRRIAPDGSILLLDGTTLKYFSSAGIFKWSVALNNISDVAIGPSGTIYTSAPNALTAWNPVNGQPLWPGPYSLNTGNETSALAIDSAGIIYVVTGASYTGPSNKVTAINPNGSLKWDRSITFRGYEQFVLSTDESVGYILDATQSPAGTGTLEHGVSTGSGNDVYGTGFPITDNTYAFAPWGSLYAGGNNGLTACTADLTCSGIGNMVSGVVTLIPPGIIVSTRSDNLRQVGLDRSGNILWTATEEYRSDISDANGTLYAIAPLTSDVVALNGFTGAQLWRQHFINTLTTILLGDDGCLYVGTVSVAVYKACH